MTPLAKRLLLHADLLRQVIQRDDFDWDDERNAETVAQYKAFRRDGAYGSRAGRRRWAMDTAKRIGAH